MRSALVALACAALLIGVVLHAGVTRGSLESAQARLSGHKPRHVLRVWDWWAPATDEKYGYYFDAVKREFEAAHPDVEVVYQFIPFGQYEQKMATAMVGNSPPDVFQCSVIWAEGFYDRGMLLPLNSFLTRERNEEELRRERGLPVDPDQSVQPEAYLAAAWKHNTKLNGTVFGIPEILDASCLVWNLDLLKNAAQSDAEVRDMFQRKADGVPDYDHLRFDAIRDWAQFRRVTRRLTKYDSQGRLALDPSGEFVQAGFAIHAHGSGVAPFEPWVAANGRNFQDAAGTRALFADDAGVEAAQFVLDLYWKDRVSPPFRRQLDDEQVFDTGKVACIVDGTWAGKYITRNTEGKLRFDLTPFPPGPHGSGQTTVTWGNMLVIARRCRQADLAWEYVKFITSEAGSLRLLRYIEQNSPRKDFYRRLEWLRMCEKHPYLHNAPAICACGKKLRNTQINATDYASRATFETLLLRYPDIEQGRGPYRSVREGLQAAAAAVDRVYQRYNAQVAQWKSRPGGS